MLKTHLGVGQGEVDPSIIEYLSVTSFDVVESGDQRSVNWCLNCDLALRPSSLDELEGPKHRHPSGLMGRFQLNLTNNTSILNAKKHSKPLARVIFKVILSNVF
jgi:hypothetical protein